MRRKLSRIGWTWQNEAVRKKSKRSSKRGRVKSGGVPHQASLERAGTDKGKDELFGFMAGRMEIVGDIESPIEDWKYWNPAKNLEK